MKFITVKDSENEEHIIKLESIVKVRFSNLNDETHILYEYGNTYCTLSTKNENLESMKSKLGVK